MLFIDEDLAYAAMSESFPQASFSTFGGDLYLIDNELDFATPVRFSRWILLTVNSRCTSPPETFVKLYSLLLHP